MTVELAQNPAITLVNIHRATGSRVSRRIATFIAVYSQEPESGNHPSAHSQMDGEVSCDTELLVNLENNAPDMCCDLDELGGHCAK